MWSKTSSRYEFQNSNNNWPLQANRNLGSFLWMFLKWSLLPLCPFLKKKNKEQKQSWIFNIFLKESHVPEENRKPIRMQVCAFDLQSILLHYTFCALAIQTCCIGSLYYLKWIFNHSWSIIVWREKRWKCRVGSKDANIPLNRYLPQRITLAGFLFITIFKKNKLQVARCIPLHSWWLLIYRLFLEFASAVNADRIGREQKGLSGWCQLVPFVLFYKNNILSKWWSCCRIRIARHRSL